MFAIKISVHIDDWREIQVGTLEKRKKKKLNKKKHILLLGLVV